MSDTVSIDRHDARDAAAILGAMASIVAAVRPDEPSEALKERITVHARKIRSVAAKLGVDVDDAYVKVSEKEWRGELESLLCSGTLGRPV